MTATAIDTDYLVVGAGATAMAFVDTLLSETTTPANGSHAERRERMVGAADSAIPRA